MTGLLISILPLWFLIPGTYTKCDGYIGGMYDHATKHIYICENANTKAVRYHEIGHYVWFNLLSEEQKNLFLKWRTDDGIESFANAYSNYRLGIRSKETRQIHFLLKKNDSTKK